MARTYEESCANLEPVPQEPYWPKGVRNCIICGKPAKRGTRYCSGDRGCPVTHNVDGEECVVL